jgi:hypothetical protein
MSIGVAASDSGGPKRRRLSRSATEPISTQSTEISVSATNTDLIRRDDLESFLELSWDKLAVKGSALASLFAFAYVVGYFYAYDITWFSFFTLTEHLVFALRSIPVALVASVVLIILVNYTIKCNRPGYVWKRGMKRLFRLLSYLWIGILLIAAVGVILVKYCIGIGLSFGAVAFGVWYFSLLAEPRRSLIHYIYWGTNVFVVCILLGFLSGYSWRLYRLPWGPSEYVTWKTDKHVSSQVPFGHIIFSGSSGVLIYDYCLKRTRLVSLDDIEEISECSESACKPDCGQSETNSSRLSSAWERLISTSSRTY